MKYDVGNTEPGYFDLRRLALFSSISIRSLRDFLKDAVDPLPHFRVRGKILVKKSDFEKWIARKRVIFKLDEGVDGVIQQFKS